MLCETSDKRIEARFWLLVNLKKNIDKLLDYKGIRDKR